MKNTSYIRTIYFIPQNIFTPTRVLSSFLLPFSNYSSVILRFFAIGLSEFPIFVQAFDAGKKKLVIDKATWPLSINLSHAL